jgi:hypothetical protein
MMILKPLFFFFLFLTWGRGKTVRQAEHRLLLSFFFLLPLPWGQGRSWASGISESSDIH